MDVVNAIPVGHKNAISRWDLAFVLGVNDRTARQMVEDARHRGELILNVGDGKGYFRVDMSDPKDLDYLEHQYRMDTSRALAILARRKAARAILKKRGRRV